MYFLLRTWAAIVALYTLNTFTVPAQYYRSIGSGNWNNPLIWEKANDINYSINVTVAALPPDQSNGTILIQSGHTIVISESLTIDEVVVESGGTLIYGNYPSSILSVSDGPGIDLLIRGTFEDSGPATIGWESTLASWALGNTGTIVRTRSTSATLWRDHYENNISTIPASSNWILRKQYTDNPSLSSINSYYGNLIIENTTNTFWNAQTVGSKMTGISSAPIIKGNMEIGASSAYGINFYSQNSALNPILIEGNLIIHAGSEWQLEDANTTTGASGIELKGNLIVHGTLSYEAFDANDLNRKVIFSGNSDQFISGNGTMSLFNLTNKKNNGSLLLERSIVIDNKLLLDKGAINLNRNTLTIQKNAASALQRTNGWIVSESPDFSSKIFWNIGSTIGTFVFPFGKDENNFIPLSISLTAGDADIVSVSTYGTGPDNSPFPILPDSVTNLEANGIENSLSTIDRFWLVQSTGTTKIMDLVFSYAISEVTSQPNLLLARKYNGGNQHWENPFCCQSQNSTSRTVLVPSIQTSGVWSLMETNEALPLYEENEMAKPSFENNDECVFPIPFKEVLFIKSESEKNEKIQIELFNSIGTKIISENFISTDIFFEYSFDCSAIEESGVFYLKVTRPSSIKIVKVIRE